MYKIIAADQSYEVVLDKQNQNSGTLNGTPFSLDSLQHGERFHILKDNKSYSVEVVSANYDEKSFELMVNGRLYHYTAKDRFDLLLKELGMENLAAAAVNDLRAPMPGLVLKVAVQAGDTVKKGDPLLVLEAMKMENVLKATADGVVKTVEAQIGKAVEKNHVLIHFEA